MGDNLVPNGLSKTGAIRRAKRCEWRAALPDTDLTLSSLVDLKARAVARSIDTMPALIGAPNCRRPS
jgi:hypothetical protein